MSPHGLMRHVVSRRVAIQLGVALGAMSSTLGIASRAGAAWHAGRQSPGNWRHGNMAGTDERVRRVWLISGHPGE